MKHHISTFIVLFSSVVFPLKFFSFCLMIAAVLIEIIYSNIKKTSQLNISFNSFFFISVAIQSFFTSTPRVHFFHFSLSQFHFLIFTFLFSVCFLSTYINLSTSYLRSYLDKSFFLHQSLHLSFYPSVVSLFLSLHSSPHILPLSIYSLSPTNVFFFLNICLPFSTFIHLFSFFNKYLFLSSS
jgi:hypothetical protein